MLRLFRPWGSRRTTAVRLLLPPSVTPDVRTEWRQPPPAPDIAGRSRNPGTVDNRSIANTCASTGENASKTVHCLTRRTTLLAFVDRRR